MGFTSTGDAPCRRRRKQEMVVATMDMVDWDLGGLECERDDGISDLDGWIYVVGSSFDGPKFG